MTPRSFLFAALTGAVLTACDNSMAFTPDIAALREPDIVQAESTLAPPGAAPGPAGGARLALL